MFNSKYSNFLTVLLVIVVLAIIGIIIYLGYDIYNKYYTNKDAEEAISQFDSIVSENNNNSDENNMDQEITGIDSLNIGNNNSNNTSSKQTYKGYNMSGYIEIPKIKIKYPILEKASKQAIKVAVAVLCGPGLNQEGNTVIIGHNYRNGLFFSNLKKLSNGDSIFITDVSGEKVKYEVYSVYETTENDATYMARDTQGRKEISLSTCTDDGKLRTIIWAKAAE